MSSPYNNPETSPGFRSSVDLAVLSSVLHTRAEHARTVTAWALEMAARDNGEIQPSIGNVVTLEVPRSPFEEGEING
jgi:hypothetical protein